MADEHGLMRRLRRIVADSGVIEDNWRIIASSLGPKTEPIWVVKSNLYGIGLEAISHVDSDIAGYGVEDCHSAMAVHRLAPYSRIFVLYPISAGYFAPDCLALVWQGLLVPTVESKRQIDEWVELARQAGAGSFGIQIKVRSYGGRFGAESAEFPEIVEHARRSRIEIDGVFSHPSRSTVSSTSRLQDECASFAELARKVAPGTPVHFSDSACVMRSVGTELDRVRIGMLPLGLLPIEPDERWQGLMPAFTLYARITNAHKLGVGETIGYTDGARPASSHVALAAIGYAHGIPRVIGEVGYAWFGGRRVPYASIPWMEFTPLSVREDELDIVGEEIEVLGPHTPPDVFARAAGKAPEEFVTRLSESIHRDFV